MIKWLFLIQLLFDMRENCIGTIGGYLTFEKQIAFFCSV